MNHFKGENDMKALKLQGEYCPYCGKGLWPFCGYSEKGKDFQVVQCRECKGNPIFTTSEEGFFELDRPEFMKAMFSS